MKKITCIRENDGTMQITTEEWKLLLQSFNFDEKNKVFTLIYEENDKKIDVGDIVIKKPYQNVVFSQQRLPMGEELTKILQRLVECLPIFKILEDEEF